MFVIGSLALLTSSLLVAGLSIRYLRRGCYMQLSLMALSFVVLDSLGLMLLPFTGLSLSYLENIIVPVLDPVEGESVYTVQLIAHLMAQGAFLLALLALPQLRRCRFSSGTYAFGWRLTQVGWLVITFAFVFSAFFYAKYFLYGPGLDLLLNFQLRFGSTTEAVTARSLAAQQVDYGQGAFGASIAAYVFLPFTAVALALILKSPVLSYASTITLGAMSLAYMLQTYQKAPVACTRTNTSWTPEG